jgi:hypothetical protein
VYSLRVKLLGGRWSNGDFLAALGIVVALLGVVAAILAIPGMPRVFHWDTDKLTTSQESFKPPETLDPMRSAENMTIRCEPACTSDTNFNLSVNAGGTKLPGDSPGVAYLGVLLPEPTALRCWSLTANGNQSIKSGLGVPDFTSGDVFSLIRVESTHPIDFNSFRRLSGDVGVAVTTYNLFAFTLGASARGESIQPIVFSKFHGSQHFPGGTIFFAFILDANDKGRVVDQTPPAALLAVTGAQ